MNLNEALDILNENGYITEATKNEKHWAVIAGCPFFVPEFFKSHNPVGVSYNALIKVYKNDLDNYRKGAIIGYYTTKKKAIDVACKVLDFFVTQTDYDLDKMEYERIGHQVSVVDYSEENKHWCNQITPMTGGYIYDRDEEAAEEIKSFYKQELKIAEEKKKEPEVRYDDWRNPRNPNSPIYHNLFTHH